MGFDWQLVAALACVLAAVVVCGRRLMLLIRASGGSGCGAGCGTCSQSEPEALGKRHDLVSLDMPRRSDSSNGELAP